MAEQTSMERTPPPQVWPTLRSRDARALIRFLVGVVGFEETLVVPSADGRVAHAQLSWPEGGGVMLGDSRTDEGPDGWSLEPGTFGAYVVTADPRAVHARAVAAGAEIMMAPTESDHGSLDTSLRDPEGNRWSFGTYRGEPRPARDG